LFEYVCRNLLLKFQKVKTLDYLLYCLWILLYKKTDILCVVKNIDNWRTKDNEKTKREHLAYDIKVIYLFKSFGWKFLDYLCGCVLFCTYDSYIYDIFYKQLLCILLGMLYVLFSILFVFILFVSELSLSAFTTTFAFRRQSLRKRPGCWLTH